VRNQMAKESARPQALLYVVPKAYASAIWPFLKPLPHPDRAKLPTPGYLCARTQFSFCSLQRAHAREGLGHRDGSKPRKYLCNQHTKEAPVTVTGAPAKSCIP
jgi:hypothetical protein